MTTVWEEPTKRTMTKGDIMDLVKYKAWQFIEKEGHSLGDVQRFCEQMRELGQHIK